MQTALGVLGFTPEVFWKMTPFELYAAFDGYCIKNGIKTSSQKNKEGEEIKKLLLKINKTSPTIKV